MIKNTASQHISFLLVSTATGLGVTGASVTGYVTKDNGTQASAGGTITEKGNGVYSYAPTQDETNADSISFLFTASGVIPVNLQIFPIVKDEFKADVSALATAAALSALNNLSAADIDTALATYDGPTKAELDSALAALNDISVSDILTTQMTESYNTDGEAPTLAQALFLIIQFLTERTVSGTSVTVKKLDGSTTAYTITLDNAAQPTTFTRTS